MKRGVYFILMLVLFSILVKGVVAETPTQVLVNSEDWRDVYSVMLFGSINKITSNFLVSDKHAALILNQIDKDNHLWVFNSKRVPFFYGL